jgi:y4mF family transcriptional regulator
MNIQLLDVNHLGQVIQEARKQQGLTQADVSGMTGVGRRFISDLENGKATAQVEKVFLVCSALGVALCAVSEWKK